MEMQQSYRPSHRSRSEGPRFRAIIITISFLLAAGVAIFIFYKILKKEIVIVPATVSYDSSLTDAERSKLEDIFKDKRLAHDVKISATSVDSYVDPDISCTDEKCKTSKLLFDIELPTTNFYNSALDITFDKAKNLPVYTSEEAKNQKEDSIYLLSIRDLTPELRVLSVDNEYVLDYLARSDKANFQNTYKGAVFRVLNLDSEDSKESYDIISSALTQLPNSDTLLSIKQTGVTALTRRMLNTLSQVGNGAYFAEKIADFLKIADVTHISNEISFANDCSNSSSTALCSSPKMFDAITAIGTDVVELTGNHNNDWGAANNIASIEKYHENGIETYGGGINEEQAKVPIQISKKGSGITMIGINESTSTKANGQGALGDHPGANIYDEVTLRQQIKEAKDRGDTVIVDIQFFECYCYPDEGQEMPQCDYPIDNQQAFFRSIIDMGADIILGTQAHQPQTYEIYKGKFIYYGTGNLFFDQTYWPGTERSLIFSHYFYNGKLLQTRITPTVYDLSYQTRLMDTAEAEAFLVRLVKASSRGE